jgi:hypothetical protein
MLVRQSHSRTISLLCCGGMIAAVGNNRGRLRGPDGRPGRLVP